LSWDEVSFCIRCGAALERRFLYGDTRPVCPQCNWIFFEDPKVAAGVLVENDGKVLLVQRSNQPFQGLWTIPAGFVNAREDPASAAARECLEETGLQVEILRLDRLISGREHGEGADIVLVYAARILGGVMTAGDDAGEVGFFPRDALPPIAFEATKVALGIK
jgi:ADP-ribose pyrophosphatase YjhB (NUDIX family)